MGFTTACYIRKNSKELQNKLKELGYRICPCCDFENAVWLSTLISEPFKGEPSVHGIGYWDEEFEVSTPKQECEDFAKTTSNIDCGENEQMFLALAALRDDTNENQWFIAQDTMCDENYNGEITVYVEEGMWLLYEDEDSYPAELPSTFRKATKEEIIEHFKR